MNQWLSCGSRTGDLEEIRRRAQARIDWDGGSGLPESVAPQDVLWLVECVKALTARVGKGEIDEVLNSCLRNEEEEAPPKKKVVTAKSDMEELFRGVNERPVTVRTLNALYRFSQKVDEDRKHRGLGTHSASPLVQALAPKYPHWYEDYPAPWTVGDLTKWTKRRLLQIKDLGPKSVEHLEAVLNKAGFQFEEG